MNLPKFSLHKNLIINHVKKKTQQGKGHTFFHPFFVVKPRAPENFVAGAFAQTGNAMGTGLSRERLVWQDLRRFLRWMNGPYLDVPGS